MMISHIALWVVAVFTLFWVRKANKRRAAIADLLEDVLTEWKTGYEGRIAIQERQIRLIKDQTKMLRDQSRMVQDLTALYCSKNKHEEVLILLLSSSNNPVVTSIGTKILTSPYTLTSEDVNKLHCKAFTEACLSKKEELQKALDETDDPLAQEGLKKSITFLNDSFNLISTLDENSSPEYVTQVLDEVTTSYMKIINLGGV